MQHNVPGALSAAAASAERPENKQSMEKEHAKILKKLGFPEKEVLASPPSAIPRVQGCMTRRVSLLDDCIADMKAAVTVREQNGKPTTTMEKSLNYFVPCMSVVLFEAHQGSVYSDCVGI